MIELIGEVKKYMALFLILKKASLNKVINERYITKEHNGSVKTKALYYETYDEFDITAVEDGIRKTIPPRVYSDKNSYEYAMKNAYLHKKDIPIYCHVPEIPDKPLFINDMGVLSNIMLITNNAVLSDKKATLIADTDDIGFEKFHEFVTTNKTIIGSLCFSQNGNVFTVSLINEDTGKSKMLFESYGADISESYRLVLFVIQHCYMDRDTYNADNFIVMDAVIK